MDQRHQHRIDLLQKLFSASFEGIEPDIAIKTIIQKLSQIDEIIQSHATRYPIDKIARADLAVLRLAVYELVIEKLNPPKVIIDEAVTLSREYGNEKSFSFVNGVLGSILKEIKNKQ